MTEFIALVAVWVVAFVTGWTAREKFAERQLNHVLRKVEKNVAEQVNKNTIRVLIEKHDGHYYVYNEKDKTFMAQGDTQEALEKMLREKYPEKSFAAQEENLIEVGFLNADSK